MKDSDVRLELGSDILSIYIGDAIQVITFEELRKIWKDLDNFEPTDIEYDIEYINAVVYDEKVVCCAYVTMILVIWMLSGFYGGLYQKRMKTYCKTILKLLDCYPA